jgi:PhzF family phenazine biosynthesis protein
MRQTLYYVDAFTDRRFSGNPAAVCLLENTREDDWMQSVAEELNLSETAFVRPMEDGFSLRWFTPKAEVKLCGHATLASAHILWETGALPMDQTACFHTLSGKLTAQKKASEIELNFPATVVESVAAPEGLLEALGTSTNFVGRSAFDYLLEVDSPDTVRKLRPNFSRIAELPVRGVIVTSHATEGEFDFVSRFFAPAVGVNEDPVTGSAHCSLGPLWKARLGKSDFRAFQASKRGGVLNVRVREERVLLGGQAVTVIKGELL